MAEEAQKEPTMEEILASIRKIISEDDDSRPASAQAQFRTVEPETEMSGPEGEPADLTIGDEDNMFEEFDLSDLAGEAVEEPVADAVEETFAELEVDAPAGAEEEAFEALELPEEVEEALKLHPDVADALVFGLEDERFGSRVAGVVSLEQGGTATSGDILEATRKLLASYKLPKDLLVVPVVPRAPNGKAEYETAKSMMPDG